MRFSSCSRASSSSMRSLVLGRAAATAPSSSSSPSSCAASGRQAAAAAARQGRQQDGAASSGGAGRQRQRRGGGGGAGGGAGGGGGGGGGGRHSSRRDGHERRQYSRHHARLRPKKLVVLDLNGLLIHREKISLFSHHNFGGDVGRRMKDGYVQYPLPSFFTSNHAVYERPGVARFLEFCFGNFDVAAWSSCRRCVRARARASPTASLARTQLAAPMLIPMRIACLRTIPPGARAGDPPRRRRSYNMRDILGHLLSEEQRRRLVFSWHNSYCDRHHEPMRTRKEGKIVFRKDLDKVWRAFAKYNVRLPRGDARARRRSVRSLDVDADSAPPVRRHVAVPAGGWMRRTTTRS